MIVVVIGTRAQLIKVAPVLRELAARNVEHRFVLTGQHLETMSELRREFGLRQPDATLYEGTERTSVVSFVPWLVAVVRSWRIFRRSLPRTPKHTTIVVHGDTASTVLGAVLGNASHFRVAHIEAGLRSRHWLNPFPEELQRVFTSRLSHLHFSPNAQAAEQLRRANVRGRIIETPGNTLQDSLRLILTHVERSPPPLQPYTLVSLHRFETVGNRKRLTRVVDLLIGLANIRPLKFILHPVTRLKLRQFGLWSRLADHPRVKLLPRQTYAEFIALLVRSSVLITDGGSNQEECSYLGHPCVLLRTVTERPEGIGENVVVSANDPFRVWKVVRHPERYRRPRLTFRSSPSAEIVSWFRHDAG